MSGGDEKRPETALEEVLHEVGEAERHGEKGDGGGEAADALTPNAGAQEQSQGDRTAPGRRH